MADETQSKSKAIVALARELLDDIELSRLSAESLLLKAVRLARLTGNDKQQKWLGYELGGFESASDDAVALDYMGWTGRWTNKEKKQGWLIPLAQIEANIAAIKIQMQTLRVPDVSYSPSNPKNWSASDYQTLSAPVSSVITKGAELSTLIGKLSGIRSGVIAYIQPFVKEIRHEKIFSGLSEKASSSLQIQIDVLIAQRAGK